MIYSTTSSHQEDNVLVILLLEENKDIQKPFEKKVKTYLGPMERKLDTLRFKEVAEAVSITKRKCKIISDIKRQKFLISFSTVWKLKVLREGDELLSDLLATTRCINQHCYGHKYFSTSIETYAKRNIKNIH